ncbi:MAG TPA: hypothetical protein VKD71_06325, partial [Gemmataceae bacterium]|nr:hypothetical protein [Gemmataceae bacterium]
FRVSGKALYDKDFTPPDTFGKTSETLLLPDFSTPNAKKLTDVSGHNRHGTIVDATWVDAATKK